MRRCPGCDFIYEDDETLCAMDGIGLVNHSGPLPFEESALPQSAAPTNSHGHGLTLIAASIILVIALFSYFHNVAKRNVLQSSPQGAAKTHNPSQPGDQNPFVVIPVETASPLITTSPALTSTPAKPDAPRKIYRTRRSHEHDPFRAPVETAIPLPRPLPTPTGPKIDVLSNMPVSSPVKPN